LGVVDQPGCGELIGGVVQRPDVQDVERAQAATELDDLPAQGADGVDVVGLEVAQDQWDGPGAG